MTPSSNDFDFYKYFERRSLEDTQLRVLPTTTLGVLPITTTNYEDYARSKMEKKDGNQHKGLEPYLYSINIFNNPTITHKTPLHDNKYFIEINNKYQCEAYRIYDSLSGRSKWMIDSRTMCPFPSSGFPPRR